MIAVATPRAGISPRCLLIGAPLTATLWAIILTSIVPAPAATICCTVEEEVRHG